MQIWAGLLANAAPFFPSTAGGQYMDEQHHHHQAPTQGPNIDADDTRQAQVFNNSGYGGHSAYPAPNSASMSHMGGGSHGGPITATRHHSRDKGHSNGPDDLFPNLPEAKKRKFILVDDHSRNSRLRVRVTLEGVDTQEIPDSFRKSAAVYPDSFFPREMQSPPPSPTGSRFFMDDLNDGDDGIEDTNGREMTRNRGRSSQMAKVPIGENTEAEVPIPRLRKGMRGREVRLNDLGYRMAWLQSRVFAQRNIFLQRALDCYRNKTRSAIDSVMQDIKVVAPHYETRVGKRKWNDRRRRSESDD
ncbi:hypothetical protein SODALDRAFT_320712 [Sodiomyces alkalinus F11]|uniref:DUF8032 domain-containing protein n=1 Tax=Sodiomyces alkalinus (strain CBS 110278 / VKM F-3762 / F11) TaxID=1314773 RepID=A0A3N2PLE3_SODAK|nr:hypothetical protein SODALDRAFT_320712 [Sodiomyces alkalinus F11]ROT35361.1 hypothetical protein SODALDRAFT_320712 [Sodiomyces alkalinus F11]